jgi:hypothetical protein
VRQPSLLGTNAEPADPARFRPTDEGFRVIDTRRADEDRERFHTRSLAAAIAARGGLSPSEPTSSDLRPTHEAASFPALNSTL